MKRLSFVVVLLFTGCGGAQDGTDPTLPGPGSAVGSAARPAAPAAGGDVSFELPAMQVKGTVQEPQALGRPGMPIVRAKKALSLENQRKKYQVTKDPVLKQAEAAILATMLFEDSKTKTGEDAKKLVLDARQVLRDVVQVVGDKVDDLTLRLLGSYEVQLEDWPAAEKAWETLITKLGPKDTDRVDNLAWWAYALLKQGKNPEALALVKDEPPSDQHFELAYVIAWAKWRASDGPGAWQAMAAAAKGWSGGDRAALDRDVLLFASRAPTLKLADVQPALFEIYAAKQPGQQYEVLAKLGLQAYSLAGRWSDAVTALEQAVTIAGGAVPASDLPVIRYSQAEFVIPLDAPDVAAKYYKQALQAIGTCGGKCNPKDSQDLVSRIALSGRLFHILYATANDVRYYQPANDLYIATIPMISDPGKRTEVNRDAETLQRTLKNTKQGTGTHDKGAIGALLGRHTQEAVACYDAALVGNPKIGGTLTLMLESDATGAVKGATTEPKPGMADMAAVAGCVIERAKTWKLPKRGSPGNTRIKLSYTMARAT